MKRGQQHVTDIVFVLSLFCVFAVLALFVVVLGANVYRNIAGDMDVNYNMRTSIAYLSEKVRQNDSAGSVEIRDVGGNDALVLTQQAADDSYETWIYAQGKKLREVTVAAGKKITPGDGQEIMDLSRLQLRKTDEGLIRMEITDMQGNTFESAVFLRSTESGK